MSKDKDIINFGPDLPAILSLKVSSQELVAEITGGQVISIPLSRSPRLMKATEAQLQNYEFTCDRYGVHWPDVDEDISADGFLEYTK